MNPPPIVAACIYYRPDPADLRRMCISLENRVQGCVFVDGPFKGVNDDIKSIREEREILRHHSKRVPTYISDSHLYEDEPEKRTFCARLAFAQFPQCTHLLVIDSDEELLTDIPIPDPGMLGVAQIISPSYKLGGATMIRLHDLTPDIRWGPSHFEVSNHGLRYATVHCLKENPHSFKIHHYGNPTKEDKAYQHYNDHLRMRREALGPNNEGEYATPSWVWQTREDTIYGGR